LAVANNPRTRASTATPHRFDPKVSAVSKARQGPFIDSGVTPFNNTSLALFQMATSRPTGSAGRPAPTISP
jgi:hypothetical protein